MPAATPAPTQTPKEARVDEEEQRRRTKDEGGTVNKEASVLASLRNSGVCECVCLLLLCLGKQVVAVVRNKTDTKIEQKD